MGTEAVSLEYAHGHSLASEIPGDREADDASANDDNVRSLCHLAPGHHLHDFKLVTILEPDFVIAVTLDDLQVALDKGGLADSFALEELRNCSQLQNLLFFSVYKYARHSS